MDTRKPIGFPQPDQLGFTNHKLNENSQQAQTGIAVFDFENCGM